MDSRTVASASQASSPRKTQMFRSKFITTILLMLLFLIVLVWFVRLRDEDGAGHPGFKVIDWISPFEWAGLGVAMALGLSVLGAGWGIMLTGSSLVGAAVRVPRVRNKNLLSILFCEAAALYGIILALTISSRMSRPEEIVYATRFTGYSYFWAGLTVGLCDLICGVVVGMVGSSVVLADAANPQIFVRVLMVEIFASAIGIIGLIIGFMQISSSIDFK